MSAMASQITGNSIVYSTVCSGTDQRKHQSSAPLAFVRGIHRWPVNSPHKRPVTPKMFPFDDVIMGFLHNILCWVYTELPRDLRLTYDQKMAKLAVTRELVGKVVCSPYVIHQKIISYSWILAITRAYSLLKSTSSTIAFNRQKRSWNLSVSLASDPTRSWVLLWSQVFAGWSWFTRLPRMSFGTVVSRSLVTLEVVISCKLVPSDTGNSRRSRPGRRSVAKHHRSVGDRSHVYHGGRAVVVLGPEFMPIDLRMACEGCELASVSWCGRKSLWLLGQLYTFCLLVCQSLPEIDVNASLRSGDKSLRLLTSPINPDFVNS